MPKVIEARVPESLILKDPPGYFAKRLRGELERVLTALVNPAHKSGSLQHSYVFADRG